MTQVFFSLATIAFIGALLRQFLPAAEEARQHLNRLVLYAFLPALVFHTVIQSDVDRLFFAIPAAAATGVLACLALSFAVFHFLPIPGPTKGAMILAAAFGNVTYFGLPVLLGLFPGHPAEAAQTSVLFEVTKSSLNLTLGAMIAIAYGSHEKITFRKTALEALKLPPIWALAAALAWKALHIPCPDFLLSATGLMAASVSGMMILSLGMALRFRIPRRAWLAVPVAGVKLAASPLIVAAAAGAVGLSGIFRDMTIMEGAMPSQLLSFVIAGRFKLDDETLAFVIMIDTILAFVTLPVVHSLLASG